VTASRVGAFLSRRADPEASLNQHRRFVLAVLLSFIVILPVTAQNRLQWERRPAQIHSADERGALTFPSTASPNTIVAQFLATHGHDSAIVRTIDDSPTRHGIASQATGARSSSNGITSMRVDQRVNGLVVYGSYVKAAINEQGQLVHLIENLAPVPAQITPASIGEDQALRAALGRIHPVVAAPRRSGREDGVGVFVTAGFF
jgi:extracellular elastinolytic metalloproteinase